MNDIFAGSRLSRKLMVGPAISAALILLLGIFLYAGVPRMVLFALLAFTMVVSIVINFLMATRITLTLHNLVKGVSTVAKGDLTTRIDTDSEDEIGEMSEAFNSFVDNLRRIMVHLAEDSEHMALAGSKMDVAMQQMVKGFEETTSQINSVAVASEELTSTSSEIARNCAAAAVIPFLIQMCNNMLILPEVSIWRERHAAKRCWRRRKSFCTRRARWKSCARRRRWYCPWSTVFRWSVPGPLPACPKDGRVICAQSSSVQRVRIVRNVFGAVGGVRT